MKIFKNILPFLILSLFLLGCGNEKQTSRESVLPPQSQDAQQTGNSQSSSEVYHYTCPNGHPGSSSAGMCSECGEPLAHNDAFHNQPGNETPQIDASGGGMNAAGVYHYVCPAGHAGGAATGGTCPECGQALIHNDAFHN